MKQKLQTSVLQLSITEGCDSACVYCDFWKIENPNYLSLKDIDKLLDVIDHDSIDLLCITGGEPTEHPQIKEVISHVAERTDTKVLISTNCLNYERLESIIEDVGHHIHTISASLDGREKAHDRNRGVKGSYAGVMKAKELAKEKGLRMKFATTIVQGNVGDLPTLLEEIGDENLDVKVTNLSSSYYGDNSEKKGLRKQRENVSDIVYNVLRDHYVDKGVKNLYNFYNALYVKHGVRPMCTVGLNEFFVFANADVYACYTKGKLTNFRETTKEELDKLREDFHDEYKDCSDCFARCSSGGVVFVMNDHYQKIADRIVQRWRLGEESPEVEYFDSIKNPEISVE